MDPVSKLEVESRHLQNDVDSVRNYLNRMVQTGEKMMADMNALGLMWEGEAKAEFTTQFETDYRNLQSMIKSMEELADSLEFAREKYVVCENEVSSIVNAIRV